MKRRLVYCIILLQVISLRAFSQESTVKLTLKEVEERFAEQNLELIAQKMNIDISEAQIQQAKLWDNPSLSISSVNLWSTKQQRQEVLMNGFPKNTQMSIELSQLIQTANKRRKMKAMLLVSKDNTLYELQETFNSLRSELRITAYQMIYLQSYLQLLQKELSTNQTLLNTYNKQVKAGNLSKTNFIRFEMALFELENEISQLKSEVLEKQKYMKTLLNIPPTTEIEINMANESGYVDPDKLNIVELINLANTTRTDILQKNNNKFYNNKSLLYEKALKVPDVTFSVNYDKYGGIWKDYVGFGVSIDLPVFNRNQGNIKGSQLALYQSELLLQQQQSIASNEIYEAYSNYSKACEFYKKAKSSHSSSELDTMSQKYAENLLHKNINMVEYLDYLETYKKNKQILLTALRDVHLTFERLQYSVGIDL